MRNFEWKPSPDVRNKGMEFLYVDGEHVSSIWTGNRFGALRWFATDAGVDGFATASEAKTHAETALSKAHVLQVTSPGHKEKRVEMEDLQPTWTQDHDNAAACEGWGIYDRFGLAAKRWVVQIIDDAEEFTASTGINAVQLMDDDTAAFIVANGTAQHHCAARDFLLAHNPQEYHEVMKFQIPKQQKETDRSMSITQVWLTTPVDYLALPDELKGRVVDSLLATEGVSEIQYYSEFNIRCDLSVQSDIEALREIAAVRTRIEAVFRSYGIWPEADGAATETTVSTSESK